MISLELLCTFLKTHVPHLLDLAMHSAIYFKLPLLHSQRSFCIDDHSYLMFSFEKMVQYSDFSLIFVKSIYPKCCCIFFHKNRNFFNLFSYFIHLINIINKKLCVVSDLTVWDIFFFFFLDRGKILFMKYIKICLKKAK